MLSLVPAFVGGMPGGVEVFVVFLIAFLLFGVPVALAVLLGYRYVTGQQQNRATDERIDDLESEIETLREQVAGAATDDTRDNSALDSTDRQSNGGSDE